MVVARSRTVEKVAEKTDAMRCAHCQAPVPPHLARVVSAKQKAFCCSGCRFVYETIHARGLERFYELRSSPLAAPPSTVFRRRSFDWLPGLLVAGNGSAVVEIQGLSCIACVWLIEKVFHKMNGSRRIRVDPVSATASLSVLPSSFDGLEFAESLHQLGYLLGPASASPSSVALGDLVPRLGICAALAMNAMLFSVPAYCGLDTQDRYAPLFARIALVCATLSMACGATYFLQRAWGALRMGIVHVDLPISLGLVAAYAGSLVAWAHGDLRSVYFDFVSMFTFLMLAGRWLRQKAVQQNRRLLLQTPLAIAQPQQGDRYSVGPGQVIPVRSELLSQDASLGLEWINGEPDARSSRRGDLLPSGAINLSPGPLALEARESWKQSLLSSLIHLPPPAEERDRPTERFILVYLLGVIALAAGGAAFWAMSGAPAKVAWQVWISVLVVSCPCASGVALPLICELTTAQLRDQGVFVREPSLWARLKRVRRIVFDKTGTLTCESPSLLNPEALHALDATSRGALAQLVAHSLHPLATSLRENLGQAATAPGGTGVHPVGKTIGKATEHIGFGLELQDTASGICWKLGRSDWARANRTQTDNHGTVFSKNGLPLANFVFQDCLRPDAIEELDQLRRRGWDVRILSGDQPEAVGKIASQLGLPPEAAISGLAPKEKADWLQRHRAGEDTLMIGDGANDSLAFEQSLCCGTPAVDRGLLEHKADFFFLGRGLQGVRRLLEAAQQKERTTRGVLILTTAYNLVAIALALSGKMHPLLASILMPLSSLVTIGFVVVRLRRRTPHRTR